MSPAASESAGPRDRLVATAERLFLERGVEGVSLREIGATAGAKNVAAVQYHLGDRAGVIRAIVDKHAPAVEARRHALLDSIETGAADAGLHTLAAVYVRPLAAELSNSDGGPGFLQVMADLVTRPEPVIAWLVGEDASDSTYRWRDAVEPHLPPGAAELHQRFTAMQFTHTQLANRARDRRVEQATFTSHLVDLVAALLGAPVSQETARARGALR